MDYVVGHCRKVKTGVGLANVAAHNCREGVYDDQGHPLEVPDWIVHPERAQLNEGDRCGSRVVLKRRLDRIAAAKLGRKPQKNTAAGIEVTISASPDWFASHKATEWRAYFKDARTWLAEKYGAANVLHWATHFDETTPHMHVLLVPIVREKGEERYASGRFLRGRKGLTKFQDELADQVGKKYGLERGVEGSEARHTDQKEYAAKVAQEADALAMERGGLDIRAKELEKQEREVERKLAALQKTLDANGLILKTTVETRATIKEMLAKYPYAKLMEKFATALHGLEKNQPALDAAWKAMRDTAERFRKEQTKTQTRAGDREQGR